MAMIEVVDVSKSYGDILALDNISFSAPSGKITGFLGPNGAGKTTTISILLGLSKANKGSALLNGKPILEIDNVPRTVGAVLGGDALHPGLKVTRTLEVQCAITKTNPQVIPSLLEQVDLQRAANRRVKHLSLGMKQRLALALALVADPDVFLLDEPANGLDPQGMMWLRDCLRQLADNGKTIFLSSHLLGELEAMADRIVVVYQGKVLREGSLAEWHQETESTVEVETLDTKEEELKEVISRLGGQIISSEDGILKVRNIDAHHLGDQALASHIPIYHLNEPKQSLEQLYLQLCFEAGENK